MDKIIGTGPEIIGIGTEYLVRKQNNWNSAKNNWY